MAAAKWSFNIQVTDGPKVAESGDIELDEFSKRDARIEPNAQPNPEVLIPTIPDCEIRLLLLKSDKLDKNLQYKLNDGKDWLELDAPLVLLGTGAARIGGAPTKLTFRNQMQPPAPANIQVIVGRAYLHAAQSQSNASTSTTTNGNDKKPVGDKAADTTARDASRDSTDTSYDE